MSRGTAWILYSTRQPTTINTLVPAAMSLWLSLAEMRSSSKKETSNSYAPSGSAIRAFRNGALNHKSSESTIQSSQESISNSSFHTAPEDFGKDSFDFSGQGHLLSVPSNSSNVRDSYSDRKSFHSLEKPAPDFRDQNQSPSTLCATGEPKSNRSSTANSTPRQELRLLSLEDEAHWQSSLESLPSTPHFSRTSTPVLVTDPSPSSSPVHAVRPSPRLDGIPVKLHSKSQSRATMEFSTADTSSIQEYQELLDTSFLPPRQLEALPPTSSRNASKPSRSRDGDFSFFHQKSRNSLHDSEPPPCSGGPTVSTVPATIHEARSESFTPSFTLPSTKQTGVSSVPAPPRRSQPNAVYLTLTDSYSFVGAASSTPLSPFVPSVVASVSPLPADRKSAISHSHSGGVAAKGKRGILDFRADLLSLNKQSEISLPNYVVHGTHVGRNSYTGELTGLPEEWQQLLQDSEISDSGSDQQKSPLAVVEICTVYPELSKSVDDGFIPSVSMFPRASAAI